MKNGRGQGALSNYLPWLTIQDVPLSRRSHRIKGKKQIVFISYFSIWSEFL
ncbi:hypothetical protein [Bacillus thuringiensis]|uniref:hypothetical protein n=1 Tax=Bacillus thuringiensis TaxID=1428 RepID=UPI001596FEFF|nr:hypothetical protein [Bacillus thuringiensis]